MNAKTLKALKGSIRKWRGIVAGTVIDKGPANCPLCRMFYQRGCRGCPVSRASGKTECGGTPYDIWTNLPFNSDRARKEDVARCELLFLESLLPRKKK